MKPYYERDGISLYLGDNLDVLHKLPDESIHACVTDPPYGLSFMGKAWDYEVPKADTWREVLRVLKPGAHLLSFFGTRTYHRGVVQIEDAGFEIRDQLAWVYGSGFPKSCDISKQMDKQEKKKWLDICNAVDNINCFDILSSWKKYSKNVNNAGVLFARNETEIGMNTERKDSVLASVALKINQERLNAPAIIAELLSEEAHRIKGEFLFSVQKNAERNTTVLNVLATIVEKSQGNRKVMLDTKCMGMSRRKGNGQTQGRRSPEDLAWKRKVLKCSGYKCSMCGTDRRLEAHHIKQIKDFPELRHESSNGLCVCHDCHYYGIHGGKPNFIHGRYSKKKSH